VDPLVLPPAGQHPLPRPRRRSPAARWGDFSYGTYVLHWPVLQLVIATGLFAIHPWLAVLVSLVLVAIGAVISWFAVENPALAYAHRRKKRRDAKRSMAHA
jgi:peptidoglycan/LPS O-acetylase OafA/YrhL